MTERGNFLVLDIWILLDTTPLRRNPALRARHSRAGPAALSTFLKTPVSLKPEVGSLYVFDDAVQGYRSLFYSEVQ